jgi:hypothetical protein
MATYLVEFGYAVTGWNRTLGRWIVALGASPTLWTGPASGARFLDAPVAWTLSRAESRQVILFVGGNESGFEHTKSIFQTIGCAAHHLGSIDCGLVFKVAVNDLLAVQVAWVNNCFQAATIMQAITEMGAERNGWSWPKTDWLLSGLLPVKADVKLENRSLQSAQPVRRLVQRVILDEGFQERDTPANSHPITTTPNGLACNVEGDILGRWAPR